jgi:uncharacterized membrane-anchored protein
MQEFFELEAAYLVIGVLALLISWFVSTRPFMSKDAPKKGIIGVLAAIVLMVGGHYTMTMNRMTSVREAFAADKQLLCESRMLRKVAQSVVVQKSKGWTLEGNLFLSHDYVRPFHAARCIVAKAINLR